MGNWPSEEWIREGEQQELDRFVKRLSDGPDVRVNHTIVTFCSLTSSDNLRRHYKRRKMEAGDCAADWIKNLVEKLGAFTSSPAPVGLGAFAIAVFIDIMSFSPPEESTKDALRCVFAEEKASEVWDQIAEWLKRHMMNFTNIHELRSDLKRIECQLSMALTKLKNSMLRDGHMTPEALKAWVNGAALHIQMLIHLVRLGGIDTCDPVERLLYTYQNELDSLFREHKEMVRKKCGVVRPVPLTFLDEDSKQHLIYRSGIDDKYFEAYYDHRYSWQKRENQQYFQDKRENLQRLVDQRDSFNFQ